MTDSSEDALKIIDKRLDKTHWLGVICGLNEARAQITTVRALANMKVSAHSVLDELDGILRNLMTKHEDKI